MPAINGINIIFGKDTSKTKKVKINANKPRKREIIIASIKEENTLCLTTFVFILFGFINPKNIPDVNRTAIEPLILPLISKKPGSKINMPGIKSNLSR